MMPKYPWETQLLKKVMLLFIVLLVPIVTVSFFELYKNNENMINDTLLSIHEENKQYINGLDNIFKDTYYNNFHILEQSSVLKLNSNTSQMLSSEGRMRVSLLREQLSSFSIINPMVTSAHAYLLSSNRVYHSAGYTLGSYTSINSDEVRTDIQSLLSTKGEMVYQASPLHQEKELSLILKPIYRKEYDYGIQLCFSSQYLFENLNSNTFYNQDKFLYELDNGFRLTTLDNATYQSLSNIGIDSLSDDVPYHKLVLDNKSYFVFYYPMTFSSGHYIRLISDSSILNTLQNGYYWMAGFFLLIICASFVFFAGVNRMVHRPLKKLTSAFRKLEQGNFSTQIETYEHSDFSYLFHAFNSMARQLENLIEHDYNQKLLLKKAELKQLQAQINPHFLYNSFFMLQRMIRYDSDQAQEIANALAVYFQYITRNSMDHVTLAEEYQQAKSYVYIQSMRYDGRIQVFFDDLPDLFSHILVPKLILQPILENAFNYGLENKIENGILRVTFHETESEYIISIEDNGEELSNEKLEQLKERLTEVKTTSVEYEMTGILNIQRRLSVFLPAKAFLTASRSNLGGLSLSVTFRK